jgi:uncharacterized protein YgbK (DUF1537 family)
VQTTCLFGAIADDYTGGSDLAGMLRERGVRTVQLFGIPEDLSVAEGYEAVVLCPKLSRGRWQRLRHVSSPLRHWRR